MGVDKAALEIAGQSLLDRSMRLLRSLLAEVYVSVNPAQADDAARSVYPVIADRLQNVGPAAGILAAHELFPAAAWLVLACDMPLLDERTLTQLMAARDSDADATALVAASSGRAEPLCAIYEPVTLAAFLKHVSGGGPPGPSAWLAGARVKLCEVPDDLLESANTQEVLGKMRSRLQSGSSTADGKQ